MAAGGDFEGNGLLHSVAIGASGLIREHHRRQSSRVLEGRTAERIQARIDKLLSPFCSEGACGAAAIGDGGINDEWREDEELGFRLARLRKQLRYRRRIDEFRVVMKQRCVDPEWTTTLSSGSGNTVLHTCARWGHVEMCRDLLKSGWCINTKNAMKQTPLLLACREEYPRVVRLLLKGSKTNGGFPKLLVRDVTGHGCLVRLTTVPNSAIIECRTRTKAFSVLSYRYALRRVCTYPYGNRLYCLR